MLGGTVSAVRRHGVSGRAARCQRQGGTVLAVGRHGIRVATVVGVRIEWFLVPPVARVLIDVAPPLLDKRDRRRAEEHVPTRPSTRCPAGHPAAPSRRRVVSPNVESRVDAPVVLKAIVGLRHEYAEIRAGMRYRAAYSASRGILGLRVQRVPRTTPVYSWIRALSSWLVT